jgi:hypothetical protein
VAVAYQWPMAHETRKLAWSVGSVASSPARSLVRRLGIPIGWVCVLMLSTIPFISITLVFRFTIALSILFPVTACYGEIKSASASPSTVVLQPETPHTAFDFINSIGLNTHLNYFDRLYGNFPLVARELQSLGVRHLRDGIHLQTDDYNKMLYGRWIQLGNLGVRFDAVLDPRSNLGPLSGAMLDKVDSLSGRTIESFEGPNEMDISKKTDWPSVDQEYQSEIFDSVKSMKDSSSIAIIGPSLAFASKSAQLGDLSRRMSEGNLHPYPAGKMPSVVFPDQINLEKVICDGEPIVITESGYHNAINEQHDQPGVSETAAAKYIPRLFLEDFMRGVPRTYLYEFLDEALDPGLTNAQLHWGLILADGSEKPAFSALRNLIKELNDSSEPSGVQPLSWTLNRMAPQIHHLLLEKSNGVYDLVLWQEVSSYDVTRHVDLENPVVDGTLTLGRQARNVTVYQPVTQAAPIHSWSNVTSVPLAIPDHPLVVEISF